jgi:predicted  nucleic acid-binding Zn-ribbon protein
MTSYFGHCPRCGGDSAQITTGGCLACGWPTVRGHRAAALPDAAEIAEGRSAMSDYTDLVARLREWGHEDFVDAADAIETLVRERDEARDALARAQNEAIVRTTAIANLHSVIAERDRALARADALLRDLAKDELLPKWLRDHIAAYLREREGGHDE